MADVKISALPAASTPLTGGEVLPVVQSGVTTKVAVSNLTAGLAGTASININGTVGATTPTTGAFTSLTASGIVTAPAQPAFLAYNSAYDLNVTGNGAVATVDFDAEIFDQGNNFAADTFTAPVTGKYRFSTSVFLEGIVAATNFNLSLVTSNRTILLFANTGTYTGDQTVTGSVLCDMDAADTAYVTVTVSGMAGNTADITGAAASTLYTWFSGELVC